MPLFDTKFFDDVIDDFGENITIRAVSKTFSDRGDATETVSDTANIKSRIQELSQADDYVKEGILRVGDIIAYFKQSRTDIIRGNRIIYNSKTYEIVEATSHRISGTQVLIEVKAKQI